MLCNFLFFVWKILTSINNYMRPFYYLAVTNGLAAAAERKKKKRNEKKNKRVTSANCFHFVRETKSIRKILLLFHSVSPNTVSDSDKIYYFVAKRIPIENDIIASAALPCDTTGKCIVGSESIKWQSDKNEIWFNVTLSPECIAPFITLNHRHSDYEQ